MHALEQPHAQRVRLAAALLPAERGLRAEFQGADGRDGLGQLRHRQLREVRQLHGALRLRGDGRRRHRGQSAEGAEGGVEGCRHRGRSEEHTSELQSLMRISYAVFCLKKKHYLFHLIYYYYFTSLISYLSSRITIYHL